MKFKKGEIGHWLIKIKNGWYVLCVCVNCKRVHAHHNNTYLCDIDVIIKCCNKPNNWHYSNRLNDLINAFVNKWRDYRK